jgi:hypothetical protein
MTLPTAGWLHWWGWPAVQIVQQQMLQLASL